MSLSRLQPVEVCFLYGQKHSVEVERSKNILKKYDLLPSQITFNIDLSFFKNCSLINTLLEVPTSNKNEIPSTYVPSRNLIFLSIASGLAETINAEKIFIGVNSVDYSGYPDCRREFIDSFNKTLNAGTKQGLKNKLHVEAPFTEMSKKEIIELGVTLNVDYSMTHSCYNPSKEGSACGNCDSCRLRLTGFKQANLKDPLDYISNL